MTSFTTRTRIAAAAASLSVLTGAALAHAATHGEPAAPTVAELNAHVVRLGDLPGFWSYDCPLADTNTASWTGGDPAEAAALRSEGFAVGVRELLRSRYGATGASVAVRFGTAAGAAADLDRREQEAGHAGYATNFSVPGQLDARGYTVRTRGLTTVRVAYVRGTVESAVQVQAPGRVDVGRLQRLLAAAVARAAGHGPR